MRAIYSPLIAAILLTHAVLGCCWQHALPGLAGEQSTPNVAQHACDHCHPQSPAPAESQAPCDCRWECHANCVYVADQSSFDGSLLTAGIFADAWLPAALATLDLGPFEGTGRALCPLVPPQPPLRLHLAHQILLI